MKEFHKVGFTGRMPVPPGKRFLISHSQPGGGPATETYWGSLDDAKHTEIMRIERGALNRRGIGFTAHLLHHTLLADEHRPGYGPIPNAGYMAFVEADGTLRKH